MKRNEIPNTLKKKPNNNEKGLEQKTKLQFSKNGIFRDQSVTLKVQEFNQQLDNKIVNTINYLLL